MAYLSEAKFFLHVADRAIDNLDHPVDLVRSNAEGWRQGDD